MTYQDIPDISSGNRPPTYSNIETRPTENEQVFAEKRSHAGLEC